MSTELKWQRVRAGWYETGNETEGAYVCSKDEEFGGWYISRWTLVRGIGCKSLELQGIESAWTLAYAKQLAEYDASYEVTA